MVNRFLVWISVRPWLRLASLAGSCMEVSWIALWFRLLVRTRFDLPYWRVFWSLGGVVWITYAVDRWMVGRDLRLGLRRLGIAALMAISALAGLAIFQPSEYIFSLEVMFEQVVLAFQEPANRLPVEFVIILTILLMSWRGLVLSNVPPDSSSVTGGFRTGVVMIFLYGLILPVFEFPLVTILFLFLGSGLLAMSTTRLALQSKRRGGKSIPFDKRWLAGLALTILVVVFSSWAVASWINATGIALLYAIYTSTMTALIWLASPFLWLIDRFVTLINQWMQLSSILSFISNVIQSIRSYLSELVESVYSLFDLLERLFTNFDYQSVQIPKPVLLWGTILFLAVIVLLTLRKYKWKGDDHAGEEELIEGVPPDLFDLLRARISQALSQLRQGIDDLFGLQHARRLLAAARIRRIYANLLRLSARLDLPRPRSTTPLEFLPKLVRLFPELVPDLNTITQAYVQVRYGEHIETQDELERVEHAWHRIKTEGERRLRPARLR